MSDTIQDDLEIDDDFADADEEWEDEPTYQQILDSVPEGWTLVKVLRYTSTVLVDMREWCVENCRGRYKEVGWESGCSYSTAVMFEEDMDTVLFRLRWG